MRLVTIMKQTVHISTQASIFFIYYPSLLIYPFFSLMLCLALETVVLFFIYLRYGIHIFNHETLELWGLLSLWEVGFLFVIFTAPLYCLVTFFMLIAKAALAHALKALYEEPERYCWYTSLGAALCMSGRLMQFAYLKTLLILVGESGIKRFLRRHVDQLGGRDYIFQAKADNWFEATFLVVPLLMINRGDLKTALAQSRDCMAKLFGANVVAQFSFIMLCWILACIIASPLAHLFGAVTNSMAGIAFFFVLFAGIYSCIRALEGIFHVIVYRFCMHKSIAPFVDDDIRRSFACVDDAF